MISNIKHLKAAVAGIAMLASAQAPAQAEENIYARRAQASKDIQKIFKQVTHDHGIRIAPMLSDESISELESLDLALGTATESYDREMDRRTYRLIRDGFNIVTMTCPSNAPSRYLREGINIARVSDPEELKHHQKLDVRTIPEYNTQNQRINPVLREVTFFSVDGQLMPLTKENIDSLAVLFRQKKDADVSPSSPLTSEAVQMMVKAYKEICSPGI